MQYIWLNSRKCSPSTLASQCSIYILRGLCSWNLPWSRAKSNPNYQFFGRCNLELYKIGDIFHILRSYVCHYIAIHELKFQLSSANAQIGAKSSIFLVHVILKCDRPPKTITYSILLQALCIISKPSVNLNKSYSRETLNLGPNWRYHCPKWPWNLTDAIGKQ